MNTRPSVRTCIQFYIYSSRLPPNVRTILTRVQPTSEPNPSTFTAHTHWAPHTYFRPSSHSFLTRFRMLSKRVYERSYMRLSFFSQCAHFGELTSLFFPYYLCLMRVINIFFHILLLVVGLKNIFHIQSI